MNAKIPPAIIAADASENPMLESSVAEATASEQLVPVGVSGREVLAASGESQERATCSERKIAANRANAKKSTGPKTLSGKRRTRMNALTNGLFARYRIQYGESKFGYEKFIAAIMAALKPVGAVEEIFADQFAAEAWRLRRLERAENVWFGEKITATAKRRCWPFRDVIEGGYSFAQNDVDQALADAVADFYGIEVLTRMDRLRQGILRRMYQHLIALRQQQAQRLVISPQQNENNLLPVIDS